MHMNMLFAFLLLLVHEAFDFVPGQPSPVESQLLVLPVLLGGDTPWPEEVRG